MRTQAESDTRLRGGGHQLRGPADPPAEPITLVPDPRPPQGVQPHGSPWMEGNIELPQHLATWLDQVCALRLRLRL